MDLLVLGAGKAETFGMTGVGTAPEEMDASIEPVTVREQSVS